MENIIRKEVMANAWIQIFVDKFAVPDHKFMSDSIKGP